MAEAVGLIIDGNLGDGKPGDRRDVHRFSFGTIPPVPFSFSTVFFHSLPQKKIHWQ